MNHPIGNVKPDNATQVFFYEQDFYVLSNFSAFTLIWESIRFDTSEAAYHFEKFRDHPRVQYLIRVARSAHEAFKIAEQMKADRRPDWDEVKVDIMRNILRAKVAQHEYVRRKLLATGDRTLIEDSWRDDFWGWGPNRNGQNMLGKLWMEIRSELRASSGDTPAPQSTEGVRVVGEAGPPVGSSGSDWEAVGGFRFNEYGGWQQVSAEYANDPDVTTLYRKRAAGVPGTPAPQQWDASQIKQPGWHHVEAAFIEGAREARANPDADDAMFRRAADGYTKRVFEEVDPVSEAALRTEACGLAYEASKDGVGVGGEAQGENRG